MLKKLIRIRETGSLLFLIVLAVAQMAERLLGGGVALLPQPERLLLAGRSAWDLAQLDLAQNTRARAGKRLASLWRAWLHERV